MRLPWFRSFELLKIHILGKRKSYELWGRSPEDYENGSARQCQSDHRVKKDQHLVKLEDRISKLWSQLIVSPRPIHFQENIIVQSRLKLAERAWSHFTNEKNLNPESIINNLIHFELRWSVWRSKISATNMWQVIGPSKPKMRKQGSLLMKWLQEKVRSSNAAKEVSKAVVLWSPSKYFPSLTVVHLLSQWAIIFSKTTKVSFIFATLHHGVHNVLSGKRCIVTAHKDLPTRLFTQNSNA